MPYASTPPASRAAFRKMAATAVLAAMAAATITAYPPGAVLAAATSAQDAPALAVQVATLAPREAQ